MNGHHPWGIIIGLYLGALYATFALTRGMNWLLRACGTQERKSAILSFVIVGLVALLVGSHTMGFGKAFVIYIPCLILWLTVGLKLSQTILVHPRVLGTAFMLAGSLLVIVPLAFIYNPVPPAPLLASLPQWEVVLYAGPYCNTPPRCWDSLAVPYAYYFALGLVLGAVGIILRVAGATQEPKPNATLSVPR